MDGPVVVVDAAGGVERELVARWLTASGTRPSAVLPARAEALRAASADWTDDVVILPVRVAWLPREREGRRRVRWSDVAGLDPIALTDRRPPARVQARTARREPDRAPVVAGAPATVGELRRRYGHPAGREPGAHGAGFAEFVVRQAGLALERAERALVGDHCKVPRHVVDAIEDSPEYRGELAALATRLELPEPEVAQRAARDLAGLVAAMSPAAVDLLTGALRPLHARAWDVQVDDAGLAELRERNRHHSLVFLPSHRSYVDPLLLADVLAEHDFPRNHVLTGENLRFWPVGALARRAGVVFIRRSFGDDEVYKLAVRQYFGYLLAKRFNLEWYLEGGRSRTGKLRPPRYGLLSSVAEAIEQGRTDDVWLVPVSITYDQLREVSAMAAEQVGAPKKGEGLAWLARYAKAQLAPIGSAYVRFAAPVSLRAALAGPDRRLALQKAAFEVCVGINRVTPVTATALVTLALLGVRDRALTLAQVRQVLRPVLRYLDERRLVGTVAAVSTDTGVRRVLAALQQSHVVTIFAGGEEPVYAIERGQHLVAAFYRNSAIHHFVDRAMAELALLAQPRDRADAAAALRSLLEFEFFFPDRETHHAQLTAELTRLDAGWDTVDGPAALGRADFLTAHRVLRSFFDAQLVVALRLAARSPRAPVVEKEFLDECAAVGQQMLLQGRLHGPESLSRELFAGALRLAAHRDLVDAGREELAEQREAFAAQLELVVAGVIRIDEIDAAQRRAVVGVAP